MTPNDELFFSSPIQDTGNSIALPISLLLIPVRSLLSKCKNDQIYLAARLAENYTDTLIQLLSLLKEASFCYRCWLTQRLTTGQSVEKKGFQSAQPEKNIPSQAQVPMWQRGQKDGNYRKNITGQLQTLIHCGHDKTCPSSSQTKFEERQAWNPTARWETRKGESGVKSHYHGEERQVWKAARS